jgi:hypothetical protein
MTHIDDLIKRAVQYDPASGNFTWLERTPDMFEPSHNELITYTPECRCRKYNTRYAGQTVKININIQGYAYFRMFRKIYAAHRVAAFLMLDRWPICIDHIDGDRTNNVWSNLREVTLHENSKNQKKRSTNTSGVTGVHFSKQCGKYIASIRQNHKLIYLGIFERLEDAAKARLKAQQELGYSVRHGK